MRGRAKARQLEAERDLALAYNTGAFSRADKVKPLSYYMKQIRRSEKRSVAAEALHFFGALKAKGLPVTITRVPRKVD